MTNRRNLKNKVMAVHSSKHQPLLLLLLLLLLVVVAILCAADAATQPSLNCKRSCGSVDIPFPFGTTEDCSLDSSFLIHCDNTTPYLPQANLTVLSISHKGELRVSWPVASKCYADNGSVINRTFWEFNLGHFSVSTSKNKLTAIGCDIIGVAAGWDSNYKLYPTGCVSFCDFENVSSGSCSNGGCCQASIPSQGQGQRRLSDFYYTITTIGKNRTYEFNRCGYAFLAENGAYHFDKDVGNKLRNATFPVVLDWTVGNQTCQEARKNNASYACKDPNSDCYDSGKGLGYLCNCSHGFLGNPYLHNDCQDIDECGESNPCVKEAKCQNFPGSYDCSCREGYEGDGKINGTGCHPKSSSISSSKSSSISKTEIILITALIVSVGVLALFVASFYVYWGLKKRKLNKLKEQFFQQNGGLLLQQKIARHRGSIETAKVFTVEELKKATNNFDEGKVLGQGGQGTVYKGLLPNNRTVAIKRSKISDPSQIEQFINEVVVLSQINHRNVVKLLGCCLETEVPLLVYEFIPNGTVFEHLHDDSQSLKLTWKTRLKIAVETAGALAHLHSAISSPIIHRDVKTTNILLDHNLTPKVSDFGASRIVPLDKTQLTTLVQGTLGYLDPEYFHTSQLTEKSDVYSFGVVLAELLTGRKALSFDVPEADRNLALYFISSIKEGRLLYIVDSHIIDEVKVEHLMEFANIAKHCLKVNREERPTMKEVAMELEGLRVEEKHRWESDKLCLEETKSLPKASSSSFVFDIEDGTGGSGISSRTDSISQINVSLGGGR